ncbi:MAG: PAS domain-containing protein, partial [Candidatus Omnitrophica bacterium]|nr:PAS domain-containing protein [Candidatus Omnitrophota bacterium]
EGQLTGVVHVATDISTRKEIEEKYRALVDNINVGIYRNTPGPRGRFIQVNPALVKMFNYDSIDEFLAVEAADHYYNPKERILFIEELSKNGSIKDKEIRFKKKDGALIMVSITAQAHYDQNGNIDWIDGMVEDITERKMAEEGLRENEMKYRTLFDSSADAIMIIMPGKGFVSGNKATIKMFGCKDETEFVSKFPSDFSPEYQPDGVLSSVKSPEMMAIAMEKGANFFEWTHKRMDGSEFFATVLLTRLELEGKKFLQATVRDVTRQKLIEEELKKRINDLERFQRITVDRELKMKELKEKISQLELKLKAA